MIYFWEKNVNILNTPGRVFIYYMRHNDKILYKNIVNTT
jgi:hypothetical protein